MNKGATVCGVVSALLVLGSVSYVLVADANFALYQWPYQAYQSLVFSIVWGFGVSTHVGYAYSALVLLSIAVTAFAIGHKLYRVVTKP
jgi:uncharacterized membrane protein